MNASVASRLGLRAVGQEGEERVRCQRPREWWMRGEHGGMEEDSRSPLVLIGAIGEVGQCSADVCLHG